MRELDGKERIIQEFVPGKQVTLAHVIARPVPELYGKLGLFDNGGSIGIFTITPSEGAMIAADIASKAAKRKAPNCSVPILSLRICRDFQLGCLASEP